MLWRCFGVIEFRVEDPLGIRIGALSLIPNFFKFQKKGGTEMAEEPISYPSVLSHPQTMIPRGNKEELHVIIFYPNTIIVSLLFAF